ncbi:BtpA/SgcQ family protein [Halobacteriales archaeon Cl-PHB]
MDPRDLFGTESALVGMVHLPPLPGAPRYDGDRTDLRGRALADALTLVEGNFDGLLVENFGDAPFYPEDVPKHVVAELTAVVRELDIGIDRPIGVNVLRNDAEAALSVAAAAGGSFVRVNCHAGAQVTDQGLLEGQAHETMRLRERIDADVAVLADVDVKHATRLGDADLETVAVEAVERGLADGLVVTGPVTGEAADADDLLTVVEARNDHGLDVPVYVGSGVTVETVSDVLEVADGAIVGTALKEGAETTAPVSAERVEDFVEVARGN